MKANAKLDEKMRDAGFVTATQVAAVTGMSRATIGKAAQAGQIKYTRVGARVYFRLEDVVDRWPVFRPELESILARPAEDGGAASARSRRRS